MNTTTNELTSLPPAIKLPAIAKLFYSLIKRLDRGSLTFTSPEGHTSLFRGAHAGPHADLRITDWSVASDAIKAAEIGVAENYRDGRMFTSDLTSFLMLCVENEKALEAVFYGKPLVALLFRIKHLLRANTRAQAKKNISAHYDMSNAFYQLWLDETMSYSSAVFNGNPAQSMVAAQEAKYQRILDVLKPQPGETILEIGCGWGGFAEYAAKSCAVKVTGITLSTAQLAFAEKRIADAELQHLVDLKLIDYRDVEGQFDYVVSIEMFEAVGERYWATYFKTVRDRLKPDGRAVIQSITIAEEVFARYRETSDFIREYIFPGGMLAPIPRFIADAKKQGLVAGEPYCFGLDYAETLKWWLQRVNARASEIKPMGFDEKFLQIWRFYLCYCEAGFRTGRTDVMQIELTREN